MSERSRCLLTASTAALLVTAGMLLILSRGLSGAEPALNLDASGLKVVMGGGEQRGPDLVVTGYAKGFALVTSGPVNFSADDNPVLHFRLSAPVDPAQPDLAPALFWRTSDPNVPMARITLLDPSPVKLSESDAWQGDITEVGFVFPRNEGAVPRLGGFRIGPETLGSRLRFMWRDWLEFEPWSQKSINFIYGGAPDQPISLLSVLVAWVVLSAIGIMIWCRASWRSAMPCLGAVLLVGWMVSDLRWTANEVRQATVTSGRLRHHAQGELPALGVDGPVWQFVRRIRQTIKSSEPARILLIRDPTREEFYALRAKYFLLPNSVALRPALRNGLDVQGLDYVLFLGAFRPQTLPPDAPVSQALRIGDLPMSPAWRDQLKLVMADPEGLLFLVPHHPRTAK